MRRPLRVLLVDDHPTDRLLAEEAFQLLTVPCTLTTVTSGVEALACLLEAEGALPDLVLVDLHMPGMNGLTVLSKIKQHPALQALPVMMLTTSVAQEDVAQAYTLHASAYLTKAMHFEGFVEQLQSLTAFWSTAKTTTWPTPLSP